MPPLSLIILKYAASPLPSTPNADSGPLYGIDWPILISVAVTPGVPPPAAAGESAAADPAAADPAVDPALSAFLFSHPAISKPKPRSAVIWSADGVCLDMDPSVSSVEATLPHRRGVRWGNPRVHREHSAATWPA